LKWQSPGRSGFQKLKSASTARSGPIAVSWAPGPLPPPPVLSFAISKKVGKAVMRNRLRRRLREAVRHYPGLPGGAYLVRTSVAAASLSSGDLHHHVTRAISQLQGSATLGTGPNQVPERALGPLGDQPPATSSEQPRDHAP